MSERCERMSEQMSELLASRFQVVLNHCEPREKSKQTPNDGDTEKWVDFLERADRHSNRASC